jgi:hypothetical protein
VCVSSGTPVPPIDEPDDKLATPQIPSLFSQASMLHPPSNLTAYLYIVRSIMLTGSMLLDSGVVEGVK